MTSRTLATIAMLCAGLALATAPAAGAEQAPHPLSTEWLAAPLLPGATDPPVCRADDPAMRSTAADTAEKLARVRDMLAAEVAASPQASEVVVLGNRGYNYGSSAVVDPNLIEFEARRLAH